MTREETIAQLRINAPKINKRLMRLQKEMEEKDMTSDFAKTQIKKFKDITGVQSSTGRSIPLGRLASYSDAQLRMLLQAQKSFLASKYSTKKGRKEIFESQLKTLNQRRREREEAPVTQDELADMHYFFNHQPKIYQQLRERGDFASESVTELITEDGYTSKEMIKAFRKLRRRERVYREDGTYGYVQTADYTRNILTGGWKSYIKDIMDNPEEDMDEIYRRHTIRA